MDVSIIVDNHIKYQKYLFFLIFFLIYYNIDYMSSFNEIRNEYKMLKNKLDDLDNILRNKCKEEFDKLDTNNSGYISIGEYLYNFFIKNNDIDYNELRTKLDKKIAIFEIADKNNDKQISLEEVIEYQYKIMNII